MGSVWIIARDAEPKDFVAEGYCGDIFGVYSSRRAADYAYKYDLITPYSVSKHEYYIFDVEVEEY